MPDDIDIKDANNATATVATKDIGGREFQQVLVSNPADGAPVLPASQADVEAVRDRLPASGTATEATAAAILAKILAAPATEAKQDTGNAALASILAKIIATPATEAKQDTGNATLASILAKIIATPATEATAAAILAKLIAAPSTEAKQDTIITAIAALLTELQAKTEPADTQAVSAASLPLPAGASTDATAAAIAALLAREALNNDNEDPATETGLPTEAYGMVFDEIRNRWHRQRGDLARGTKVYHDELLAQLEVMNQTLASMASAMPQPDYLKRLRFVLEVVTATNMSMNAAQWGGQSAASGAGASGNGAPRVTPANDTVAGSPQLFALYQSMLAPGMTAFYDRATY